jgi:hypothetical protein
MELYVITEIVFVSMVVLQKLSLYFVYQAVGTGTLLVAQWLRQCVTNRKVTGSIPDGVIGIFH